MANEESMEIRGEIKAISLKTGGILLGDFWDLATEEKHEYNDENKKWLNPHDELKGYDPRDYNKGDVCIFKILRDGKFFEVKKGQVSTLTVKPTENKEVSGKKIYTEAVSSRTASGLGHLISDCQHNKSVRFTQTHYDPDNKCWVAFVFYEDDPKNYLKCEVIE